MPVVSLVQRDGHVASYYVANVTSKELKSVLVDKVHAETWIMTDESPLYPKLGKAFAGHGMVRHTAGEYVSTGGFKHTNTVENYFSIFKRGVIGTYHHLSEAHLPRYTAEFDFRYNTRKVTDAERTQLAMIGARGKRLTYRRPDIAA